MATIVTPGWDANHVAVHREYLMGQSEPPELSLLRHPSYPFLAEISANPSTLFEELRRVAQKYIERVKSLDRWLAGAYELLTEGENKGFGWLPITWDGPARLIDPRGSFVVRRYRNGAELDRTVVLMAGNRSVKGDVIEGVDGFAVGLRVVMHVDPSTPVQIRVTGLSMCELRRAICPAQARHIELLSRRFHQQIVAVVQERLGFIPETVKINGIELVTEDLLRIGGVGARPGPIPVDPPDEMATGFLWNVEIGLHRPRRKNRRVAFVSVREQEQYSYAVAPEGRPKLFHRDPASSGSARGVVERSPTRDAIDSFRERPADPVPETLQDHAERFKVLQSFVADLENDPADVQKVDLRNLPLRSDHLSAAQAFLRAREFFDRLSDFALPEAEYFKFARLPLLMRHRAAFHSSPDGKAVRAQVRVVRSPLPFRASYDDRTPWPQLEVAFGSAALRHREVHLNDHRRPSAQPLGLAADRRWAWHEFGHVLSYAATGALEYEFAHSAGDALAAVLNDATSCLAGEESLYDGETYPWVPAGRRHDRDAAAGWCWCGRRNGQRHARPTFPPLLYKGYVEEQMLSSSVFRLYRAIGGHPKNDPAMRTRAAAAAAYLLMRSALLLGPGALVPARSADALVSAMVDADIGTRQPGDLFLGGCLHKVVRWAFERQGLFATAAPDQNVEGPGLPPAVDLWVMDRRLNAKDGGYEPVTLEWPTAHSEPCWFADPREGVCKDANGNIHVVVRNRGACDATAVDVRAWAAPAVSGPLDWRCVGHHCLDRVPGGGHASACIAAGLGGAKHYLLVDVSATADASNLDADRTRLPCASGTPPKEPGAVRDLVANDNNLALLLI